MRKPDNYKIYSELEQDLNGILESIIKEIKKFLGEGKLYGVSPDQITLKINDIISEGFREYKDLIGMYLLENARKHTEYTLFELTQKLSVYRLWGQYQNLLEQRIDYFLQNLDKSYVFNKSSIDGMMIGERIKLLEEASKRVIRSIIYQSVANGESAFDLAKKLEAYIKPKANDNLYISPQSIINREFGKPVTFKVNGKTPMGSVKYNALRIARTEMADVARQSLITVTKKIPFVKGYRWNLSRSHPKEDICDWLASYDHDGLGAGIFRNYVEVKRHSHPNCLCYITVEIKSPEELSKILDKDEKKLAKTMRFKFDEEVEKIFSN